MSDLNFAKGQALGNDYLVVDAAELARPLSTAVIRGLCDRHIGAGSDGVLVGQLDGPEIRLRIFNPDGTEAEKSGNGLRIFGAYLHGRGLVGGEPFGVRLIRDSVRMQVLGAAPDGSLDIVVDIGRASFRGEDVGFAPESGEVLGYELDLGDGLIAKVNPVSLSNPHCVVFVDTLEREDFLRRAPRLVAHPAFPAGTNVQFARVIGPADIEAWIWERGVGETLASGSSASAVASAAKRLGLIESSEVTVHMRGGQAKIGLQDDGMVRLRGPAQIVYRGTVPARVVEGWEAREGAEVGA